MIDQPPAIEIMMELQDSHKMAWFEKAIEFVLSDDIEGGYVNDPDDPGGETKFGISKRAYPSLDIKTLSKEAAKHLYFKDYWKAGGCVVLLEPKLAIVHFDACVNHPRKGHI